jgi:hypothetical protein
MFVVEGLPATIIGFFILRMLSDRPEEAEWLSVKIALEREPRAGWRPMTAASPAGTPPILTELRRRSWWGSTCERLVDVIVAHRISETNPGAAHFQAFP